MRFSGSVSVRDHQDLLDVLAGPGRLKKRAWAASLLMLGGGAFIAFSILSYLWFLGGVLRRGEAGSVLAQPYQVGLLLLGLLMIGLLAVWLRGFGRVWSRLRALPKDGEAAQEMLREGVNIGEMVFEADERGLIIASSLVHSTYAWNAFQELVESERSLFLVVDAGAAVILPKEAFGGEPGLLAFKALAGPRVGAAA